MAEKKIKNNNKKEKRIERLQNLGRTVNSYISIMENTSDTIITEDQFIDNSLDIMFSKQLTLNLNETIHHWKRKMDQTTAIQSVIDVYSFVHIVALLKIYEDIEKNKEIIQKKQQYRPKRKKSSVEWIFKYMSDEINLTLRHTKKMYAGVLRLKELYEKGVSFDILIRSGCTPTEHYSTMEIKR